MNNRILELPAVAVWRVHPSTTAEDLVLEGPDGAPVPAEAVWSREAPDWSRCAGLRVVVGQPEGTCPVVLGLLDAPPAETTPESLKVESTEELVIECGKAKIALRADGRIEIRGGHLISRASGPNKIKGGSVHIN